MPTLDLHPTNTRDPCAVHPWETDSCHDAYPADAGLLECHVGENPPPSYWENKVPPDPALKGMSFAFASPPRNGINVMSYRGHKTTDTYSISGSQIEVGRKYLRWDVPIRDKEKTIILRNINQAYGPYYLSGDRPFLGNWNLREPADKLDFDGDGRRDIGVWYPPTSMGGTGYFFVLLSHEGFSQDGGKYLWVGLGGLGDIPVPADYNGDGRTDVAVFQPGGGLNRNDQYNVDAYWRWCPTNSVPEAPCTSPQYLQYGRRGDIPQPGLELDGAAGDELSVYRPSGGTWHFRNLSGSMNMQRSIGTANAGVVPLGGLYDCDSLGDLAVYEPALAKFTLLPSENNWNGSITRYFDDDFIPKADGGTSRDRSGGMPLAGIYAPRYCRWWVPRRSFAVFFPDDGTWNILWTPIESSTVLSCQYGNGSIDQPIANIDRNADNRTEMALFRAYSYNGPGTVYMRNSLSTACNGTNRNVSWSSYSVRRRLFGVRDMTGDGKPDILVVDPEPMIIDWIESETDYGSKQSRSIGGETAVVL
ncbi:MAG: VCBS repeat-containing protein [Deltaproteobacteria bacterium]|nr:VCBS repeat-containing protein [Deltaproteobacteria bacterium]